MNDGYKTTVKENDDTGWSSDCVVLWLGRRQNRNMVEWWREWPRLRWYFYSSGGWESSGPRRIACNGCANLMLQFQLERGGDRKRCCWKMKRRQSSSWLNEKKVWHSVMVWRHRSEKRRHRGGKREETMSARLTRILLDQKIKKIYTVDSVGTNGRWRFKTAMS
jgi:hypothetical protein